MHKYYITFSPPIFYWDKDNLPTKNGIYLIFEKIPNKNPDNSSYEYSPLYLGKVCRENKMSGGIKQRILEHLNDTEDKICISINFLKNSPKDSNGVRTPPGTKNNIGKPPAVYITCSFLDNNKILEEVEAALIFSNRDKLILNEKNKESYNGEDITINIQGATYGLKPQISLKKCDRAYF